MILRAKLDFDKLYKNSLLLFAFTLPLSRAAVSFFSIWFVLLWIMEGGWEEKVKSIKNCRVLRTLLLFILLSTLTFFISEDQSMALSVIKKYFYFMIPFVFFTSLRKEKEYIHSAISFFLAGMFISEIIAYGIYFEWWQFNGRPPSYPSPFMSHIDYSIFLALSSIILLYRLFSDRYGIRQKILYALFFVTVTGNLFISIGRTGQLAYLVALIVFGLIRYRFSIKAFGLSLLLILSIFTAAYHISDNFKARVVLAQNDILRIVDGDLKDSWGIRLSYWIVTFNILREHPWGNGIGDFKLAVKEEIAKEKYSPKIYAKSFLPKFHPHNQYLMILLQTGVVGLSLFLLLLYRIVKLPIRDRELKDLSLLFVTIYIVGFMAEPLLWKQFTAVLFSMFTGLFLAASREESVIRERSTVPDDRK